MGSRETRAQRRRAQHGGRATGQVPASRVESGPRCALHREVAATVRCSRCARALCDPCFCWMGGGEPLCAACHSDLATQPWRRRGLTAVFAALVAVVVALYLTGVRDPSLGVAVVVVVGALGMSGWLLSTASDGVPVDLRARTAGDAPSLEPAPAHPYRSAFTRARQRAAVPLSGRTTAFIVGGSLAVSAVLVPVALRLPRWLEYEIVLGAWWAVLAATLAALLHGGLRLTDDYRLVLPWQRPFRRSPIGSMARQLAKPGSWFDASGCIDLEGVAWFVVLVVALGATLGAAWLVIELVWPLTFVVVYTLVRRALGAAVHDRHECAGRPLRAIAWGALWATVYVSPLALLVWGVHAVLKARGS